MSEKPPPETPLGVQPNTVPSGSPRGAPRTAGLGWAVAAGIGIGVGFAFGVTQQNLLAGLGLGVGVGIALALAFGAGARRTLTGRRALRLSRDDDGMAENEALDDVWDDWKDAVNMTRKEIEDWLDTDESKSVGDKSDGDESTGHQSGRRIVEILGKHKADLDDDDVEWMRKVVGYVHRHRAQGPESDVEHSRWRYSLMNWGNDPLKD